MSKKKKYSVGDKVWLIFVSECVGVDWMVVKNRCTIDVVWIVKTKYGTGVSYTLDRFNSRVYDRDLFPTKQAAQAECDRRNRK